MHSCYAGMYLDTYACVFVCVFGEVSAFAVLKLELDEMTTTMKREKSRIKPFDESIFFYCSRAESLGVFYFSWLEEKFFVITVSSFRTSLWDWD